MQNNRLAPDHFFRLADARNRDYRQDQYVALLEAAPQTEKAALAILRTVHHRQETSRRRDRKWTVQPDLTFDPIAPQGEDTDGHIVAALSCLPLEDQDIISQHIIEGMSLRDIAKQQGVSKDCIRKRYDHAKQKLQALAQKE
ncbi:RNA polymerase sigma factor [Granulicella mallensis]|uniref:Sigma-70 region 4 type 2 n=1 Tax=Granulicella mallensis (strain ATCC BAA-1857 / DSM 23137 / MP5ACTX8) TaxID=682795 RepID=G8NR85_GRAMM|nr:sigma factor-like helix-turn-helix DNA-binding protein [Granulicella mallensis]AEU36163.1 Sigma-70 region 4 type 2 [Granulicella mallensis MP5ACTX8]